ncbi:MAG: T9SS type A sorting domain-containing protein [Bacteroidota bacterium]
MKLYSKRLLLVLSICFLALSSKAQYQPLVVDSALWIIQHETVGIPYPDSYFGYYILNDTTVNSINYKKIYKVYLKDEAPNWPQPFKLDSLNLFGFIREDLKKVYAITFNTAVGCPANSEFLLYDFSYIVGDTTNLCLSYYQPSGIVSNIIPSGGVNTFYLNNSSQYTEQIGAPLGLFEGIGTPSGMYNTYFYQHCIGALANCNISTGYKSNEIAHLEIFPNPSSGKITIRNFNTKGNAQFEILNCFGTSVFNGILPEVSSDDIQLNLPLNDGVYFLVIKNLESYDFVKKIIIFNDPTK